MPTVTLVHVNTYTRLLSIPTVAILPCKCLHFFDVNAYILARGLFYCISQSHLYYYIIATVTAAVISW